MRGAAAILLFAGLLGAEHSADELRRRLAQAPAATPSATAAAETAEQLIDSAVTTVTRTVRVPASGRSKRSVRKTVRQTVVNRDRLEEASKLIAQLEAGADPFVERSGDFRQALRSPVDGSLQPYRVVVPKGLDPANRYPLIIALHGAHGDENTYLDSYADRVTGDRVFRKLGDERGYFLAAPRRYQGQYEADVLAIVDRLKQIYPIQEDQVFLTGHSSGGVGTWTIGLRHADRFAAMAAVGSAFQSLPGVLDRMGVGTHVDRPMLYCHGEQDRLTTNSMARRMADFLQSRLSYFVFRQFPDGHNTLGIACMTAVFDFFDSVRNGSRTLASDGVTQAPDPPVVKAKKRRGPAKRTKRKKTARG